MRLSVLDTFGLTALLRTRTNYSRGATRLTHDHCHGHNVVGHHSATAKARPARPLIIRYKADMIRFLNELASCRSLQDLQDKSRRGASVKATDNA
jgi:hypothetical protein